MIDELTKTFFDTFGIKPKKGYTTYDKFTEEEADVICNDKCAECSYLDDVYPPITDRILLHLLCILNNYGDIISSNNIKKLQDEILIKTITLSKDIDITPQVRALFGNK